MKGKPPAIEYEAAQRGTRVWGLGRPVWLLIAFFCAVAQIGGWFVANGRINGWLDVGFVIVLAVAGMLAVFNAWRAGRAVGQ